MSKNRDKDVVGHGAGRPSRNPLAVAVRALPKRRAPGHAKAERERALLYRLLRRCTPRLEREIVDSYERSTPFPEGTPEALRRDVLNQRIECDGLLREIREALAEIKP